jgi:hypothetical protein
MHARVLGSLRGVLENDGPQDSHNRISQSPQRRYRLLPVPLHVQTTPTRSDRAPPVDENRLGPSIMRRTSGNCFLALWLFVASCLLLRMYKSGFPVFSVPSYVFCITPQAWCLERRDVRVLSERFQGLGLHLLLLSILGPAAKICVQCNVSELQ